MLNPGKFWQSQKENEQNSNTFLKGYFFVLLIFAAIAVFIGEFFRRTDFFIEYPLLKSLRIMVLIVTQYFISVNVTNELLKGFGGKKNKSVIQELVIFSMTPLMLVSIVTGLFPFLYIIDVFGMYSLYLFWIGAKTCLHFTENKQNSFLVIAVVVNFLAFAILSILLSKLLAVYY